MKVKDEKAFYLEKTIITKMERRIKRLAFNKYKQKTMLTRRENHEAG